jgi:hypothetical protein
MTKLSDTNPYYRTDNATATASDIAAGKVAYIKGGRVVGQGTDPIYRPTGGLGQYWNTVDADIVAADVTSGTTAYGSSGLINGTDPLLSLPIVEEFSGYNAADANTTTLVLPALTGVQAGDLLILIVGTADTTTGADRISSTGFTRYFEEYAANPPATRHGVFWKEATGSEGDITVNYLTSGYVVGHYLRISGANTTAPIDQFISAATQGATAHSVGSITPTSDYCLLLSYNMMDEGTGSATHSVDNSYTKQGTQYSTTTFGVSSAWAKRDMITAGATGTTTWSVSGTDDGMWAVQLSILPA